MRWIFTYAGLNLIHFLIWFGAWKNSFDWNDVIDILLLTLVINIAVQYLWEKADEHDEYWEAYKRRRDNEKIQ